MVGRTVDYYLITWNLSLLIQSFFSEMFSTNLIETIGIITNASVGEMFSNACCHRINRFYNVKQF